VPVAARSSSLTPSPPAGPAPGKAAPTAGLRHSRSPVGPWVGDDPATSGLNQRRGGPHLGGESRAGSVATRRGSRGPGEPRRSSAAVLLGGRRQWVRDRFREELRVPLYRLPPPIRVMKHLTWRRSHGRGIGRHGPGESASRSSALRPPFRPARPFSSVRPSPRGANGSYSVGDALANTHSGQTRAGYLPRGGWIADARSQLSRGPADNPAGDAVGPDADEQSPISPSPRDQRVRGPQIGQGVRLAHGAGTSLQDDAPPASCLLVELVDFKRDPGRLGQL
jgi:hypothetical protein